MSWEASQWVLHASPAANPVELAVLWALADRADPDGCGAFPARMALAEKARSDPKTVQRALAELKRRGVIAEGDQDRASYIRADRRPTVWDVLVPAAWYSTEQLAKINDARANRGLPAITPETRPPLDAAPERAKRKDFGVPRKRMGDEEPADDPERGDSESPRCEGTENPPEGHGGTSSPARGDSKSRTGGLEVPRTIKEEPIHEPSLSHLSQREAPPRPTHPEGERENDHQQLVKGPPRDPADVITDAYAKARANAGRPAAPSTLRGLRAQVVEILAAGNDPAPLAQVAAWMGTHHPGWRDLDRARTAPGAPGVPLKPGNVPRPREQPRASPCATEDCYGHNHDQCDNFGRITHEDGHLTTCPCWEAKF